MGGDGKYAIATFFKNVSAVVWHIEKPPRQKAATRKYVNFRINIVGGGGMVVTSLLSADIVIYTCMYIVQRFNLKSQMRCEHVSWTQTPRLIPVCVTRYSSSRSPQWTISEFGFRATADCNNNYTRYTNFLVVVFQTGQHPVFCRVYLKQNYACRCLWIKNAILIPSIIWTCCCRWPDRKFCHN